MILSRLRLDPHSRQVQRELADPYQMHRTILRAFPTPLPELERVLYRYDITPPANEVLLLVQSQTHPDWSFLHGQPYLQTALFDPGDNPSVKTVSLNFTAGQYLHFRLRANPTQSLPSETKGGEPRPRGHRVALYREECQREWLVRKAAASGFCLRSVNIKKQESAYTTIHRREKTHEFRLSLVQFDGLLQVTDPYVLLQAINRGIGHGKVFGCGMFSLAPC